MAEDLQGNWQNYKLQLQQVEAALTTDPTNKQLLKLKINLEEVIELTRDVMEVNAAEGAEQPKVEKPRPKREWKVGDKCLAIWSEDTQYYEATIEDMTQDGKEVSVMFDKYKYPGFTTLASLKEVDYPGDKKSKKQAISKQREYQKKKKQKKLQRFKEMEEEREGEKNKWLAFNSKTTKKGMTKKSIFASPDNVNGRVGIGTCGISGRPMTEFAAAEKWRRGT